MIKTNNHPREVLHWCDLSEKEQREFDYLVPENYWTAFMRHQREVEHLYGDEPLEASFIRYKGQVYDLGEFTCVDSTMCLHFPEFKDWSSYQSDSYFSGVVVRYVDEEFEAVVVGTYCS